MYKKQPCDFSNVRWLSIHSSHGSTYFSLSLAYNFRLHIQSLKSPIGKEHHDHTWSNTKNNFTSRLKCVSQSREVAKDNGVLVLSRVI